MASIFRETTILRDPLAVWDAVRDFDHVGERLVPGFVTACAPEPGARLVTFFNGVVAREVLVGIDEAHWRLSYSSVSGRATHHNASVQIFAHGEHGSRLVWITDVLPDALAEPIAQMMDRALPIIAETLALRT